MAINAGGVYSELVLDTSKFNSSLAKASQKMAGFENNLKSAGDKLDMSKQFTKAGKKLEQVGTTLTKYVTLPIVGMGTAAVKASIDFESAMAGVRKTVDISEEGFKTLTQGIRDMSKELPTSATAIAGVAEAAGQLGIKNESLLSFTRVMIDLGESTNLSADEAATALARFANITQMSQKDFDRLGSSIVDLGNNLATSEAEIVAMGMRLAGAGKQIGLTEAQIMSFAGALSSVGVEAEMGGSAFSRLMVNMQLAVETGNKDLKNFANVAGMTSKEFQKAFKEDAAGALIAFIKGLSTAEERGMSAIKVLDDMGIKEIRLRDALLRASGASNVFTESLKIGTKAWDENNALTKEASQRYATTESKLKMFKNQVIDAGIKIGEILLPYLMKAVEKLQGWIDKFNNLSPAMQKTIVKIAGVAAATGPLLIAGGKVAKGIGGITKLVSTLSGVAGVATTATAGVGTAATAASGLAGVGGMAGLASSFGAAALAAGPYLLAAAAVGVAGYAIYKGVTEETIPAVDLFAEKLEYTVIPAQNATDAMVEYGESVEVTAIVISEATQKAVGAYVDMDNGVREALTDLYINSTQITEQNMNELVAKYEEMGKTINEGLEKSRQENLNNLQDFFNKSVALSAVEEAEILKQTDEFYNNKKNTVDDYQKQIQDILQKAADEHRAITEDESKTIIEIQDKMREKSIKILSENELEAKVILERLKEYDKRITAEQAGEHIQKLNESKDKAIAAANEEYEKRIAAIVKMRDEAKIISAEQADALIKDAQRVRDDTIDSAEKTRREAVSKIFSMNEDLINNVDSTTGKIINWWQKLWGNWDKWKPEPKTFRVNYDVNYEEKYMRNPRVGNNAQGTNYWRGGLTWVGEQGRELIDLPRGAKVLSNQESEKMLNNTKNNKPSLVIENFNNYRESDVEELAYEFEIYRRSAELALGGA